MTALFYALDGKSVGGSHDYARDNWDQYRPTDTRLIDWLADVENPQDAFGIVCTDINRVKMYGISM